jgi:hypothetical protein
MGNRTTIDAEIVLKPEAIPIIEALHATRSIEDSWLEVAKTYPWLEEWANHYWADFIPFGNSSEPSTLKDGVWSFCCAVKDSDDTIQYFFENVLPKLAQEIPFLETELEDPTIWVEYGLKDGKVVELKRRSRDDDNGWGMFGWGSR